MSGTILDFVDTAQSSWFLGAYIPEGETKKEKCNMSESDKCCKEHKVIKDREDVSESRIFYYKVGSWKVSLIKRHRDRDTWGTEEIKNAISRGEHYRQKDW